VTRRKRLYQYLDHPDTQYTPVSFWRHFPSADQEIDSFVEATVNWQEKYDFDFVKVTPPSSFCLKDWGARDIYTENPLGVRTYPVPAVKEPDDWFKLAVLDPEKGWLGRQIEVLKGIRKRLGDKVPIIQSVFSPMVQCENLVGSQAFSHHLSLHSQALAHGLEMAAQSTILFIKKAAETGIDGIYYIIKHPSPHGITLEQYNSVGKPLDVRCLKTAEALWFNVLHLHVTGIELSPFLHLPVQVLSLHDWNALESAIDRKVPEKAICGGLERKKQLLDGTPEEIYRQSKLLCDTMRGIPFVLGANCGLHINTSEGNIRAAINAARK
jgi:uroporphyrinogen decarboxylase